MVGLIGKFKLFARQAAFNCTLIFQATEREGIRMKGEVERDTEQHNCKVNNKVLVFLRWSFLYAVFTDRFFIEVK
jgi:hypothetical protein